MPPPTGLALQFFTALSGSHYMVVVFLLELISALLLLTNLYVPLSLTLLAPVIVNILLFHAFMAPAGLPLGIVLLLLWIVTALSVRSAFSGLFVRKAAN